MTGSPAWPIFFVVYDSGMVEQVRAQMLPLLTDIIEALEIEQNDVVSVFFQGIRQQLIDVESEADLMGPFVQLAGTAPLVNAVGVDPRVLFKIDELLALAQELAHTLSASSLPH